MFLAQVLSVRLMVDRNVQRISHHVTYAEQKLMDTISIKVRQREKKAKTSLSREKSRSYFFSNMRIMQSLFSTERTETNGKEKQTFRIERKLFCWFFFFF